MANTEIKDALRTAANIVAEYVKDAGTLKVETRTAQVGHPGEPVLAASTEIRLDGDNKSVIPAVQNQAGRWEVDTVIYDLHMQNVQAAIEYRKQLLAAMLGLLRG